MIPHFLATLGLIGIALLLGAGAYESVVMAPNFERDIPASIESARQFLKRTTPAHYFRILTPITQLLLVAGAIMSWQAMAARWALLTALGILVSTEVITFTYHYPRLAIMFKGPMPDERREGGTAGGGVPGGASGGVDPANARGRLKNAGVCLPHGVGK